MSKLPYILFLYAPAYVAASITALVVFVNVFMDIRWGDFLQADPYSFIAMVLFAVVGLGIALAAVGLVIIGGFLVGRKAYQWNEGAVVVAAILLPSALFYIANTIADVTNTELFKTGDMMPFYIIGFVLLVIGTITYNDIKYRMPR